MIYPPTCPAIFLSRPNRFVAICQIGQRTVRAHVRNTGRLGELLLPGAEVWLLPAAPGRKTAYTLIAGKGRAAGTSIRRPPTGGV